MLVNFIRLLPPTADKEAVTKALTGFYFVVFSWILDSCDYAVGNVPIL